MKVLVADDDPVTRCLLQATLQKAGYDVMIVRNGIEAWEALRTQDDLRLVILDWIMPGLDGLQVCQAIRSCTERPHIYLLLLTVKTQKEELVQGLEAGADDFLSKPFDPEELRARLRVGVRILELEERLRLQATHDTLTGLWNHGAIMEILRKELARSRRERKATAILAADLDRFKLINDTHGHLAGDVVLHEVARRIVHSVRGYDAVGRTGGDEFLIVAPGCNEPDGMTLARRVRKSISSRPIQAEPEALSVGVSLGVAVTQGDVDVDASVLLRAADKALYQAKKCGPHHVCSVDSATSTEAEYPATHPADEAEGASMRGGPM